MGNVYFNLKRYASNPTYIVSDLVSTPSYMLDKVNETSTSFTKISKRTYNSVSQAFGSDIWDMDDKSIEKRFLYTDDDEKKLRSLNRDRHKNSVEIGQLEKKKDLLAFTSRKIKSNAPRKTIDTTTNVQQIIFKLWQLSDELYNDNNKITSKIDRVKKSIVCIKTLITYGLFGMAISLKVKGIRNKDGKIVQEISNEKLKLKVNVSDFTNQEEYLFYNYKKMCIGKGVNKDQMCITGTSNNIESLKAVNFLDENELKEALKEEETVVNPNDVNIEIQGGKRSRKKNSKKYKKTCKNKKLYKFLF